MSRVMAEVLWEKIITHARTSAELAGEGNSGEFHDPTREEQLSRGWRAATQQLIESFHFATGFLPVTTECGGETDCIHQDVKWHLLEG